MKKQDIETGGQYVAKVSGKLVTVRVTNIYRRWDTYSDRGVIQYDCINEATGRQIIVKSARRFRCKSRKVAN